MTETPKRSAIVVSVDRLGAGFLGSYGNTWLETSAFNRLSSQAFLFEQAVIDSPRLEVIYRSYWSGLHAVCRDNTALPTLPVLAASAGFSTVLLTDDPAVAEHSLAKGFAEHLVLSPEPASRRAQEPEETEIGRLFAAAADLVTQARPPFLLWIHSRGMSGAWDAPSEFRTQFADADDPEPTDVIDPPARKLAPEFDPDEVWGMVQAYAGQVSLLDFSLGVLLEALESRTRTEQTLFAFTSPRGFPLGEHLRVGAADDGLYGELLHVPLLLRLPDGSGALERSQTPVQPADLFATLADWLGLPVDPTAFWGRSLLPVISGERTSLRDRACAVLEGQRAIRTPAWFMRESGEQRELFVKPDDRWEVNEVAARCVTVAEELSAAIDQFEQSAQSSPLLDSPPLSAVLAEGWD